MTSSAVSVSRVADMRAKRGARWLDENVPGWEKRINLRTLRLADGESCICGQVFKKKAVAEAKKTGRRFASGYSYAADHLFEQANSWVTSIVPKDDDLDGIRGEGVAVALGFDSGSLEDYLSSSIRFKSDRVFVNFSDLQTAWVKLVGQRKARVV